MQKFRIGLVMAGMALLAACSAPPPPPPPPPPPAPPKIVVVPPRPAAPDGVSGEVRVPVRGADGVRHTVLVDSEAAQRVWYLRSALNVAALNCTPEQRNEIVPAYGAFLKKHASALKKANEAVDQTFRAKYGKTFLANRETQLTQLYNYYAYPPTLPNFCASALDMARESRTLESKDLAAFSERGLARFVQVYEDFYQSYERYKSDLAEWENRYGMTFVPGQSAARGATQ